MTWGCLYNLWEVPIARIWKNICGNVIFGVPEIPLLLGVLGAWMTFKKAEMAKTLKNGLIMIETNPLNHNWSHFVILSGLTLHQFQKKLLLRRFLSEKPISCHLISRSRTHFSPIVTLNENNWVAKYIDWFCVYYLDCLKNVE